MEGFRIRKFAFFVVISLGILGSLTSSLSASKYEELFQKGFEQETAKNWSAAVQWYLEAIKQDPLQPFPRNRLERIFHDRLKAGESIETLRALLPPELENEFEQKGFFRLGGPKREPISILYDVLIWGSLIAVVLGIAWYIFRRFRRETEKEEEEAFYASVKKTRIVPSDTGSQKRPDIPLKAKAKKDAVVTEKTRDEIEGLFDNVSSLTQEMKRPDFAEEVSEEKMEELQESEVVKALAQTLLSDVKVEEKEGHKYSKLSMDASLLFDESDVSFFEKEFEATPEEISAAKKKDEEKK